MREMSENLHMDDQMLKEMTDAQLMALLERIQQELDERKWNAIFANPKAMKLMAEMADQALQEHLEGKTVEGGFGRGEVLLQKSVEEGVLDLGPDDVRFLAENLLRPLESPEKEAPHLYEAIKRNNL